MIFKDYFQEPAKLTRCSAARLLSGRTSHLVSLVTEDAETCGPKSFREHTHTHVHKYVPTFFSLVSRPISAFQILTKSNKPKKKKKRSVFSDPVASVSACSWEALRPGGKSPGTRLPHHLLGQAILSHWPQALTSPSRRVLVYKTIKGWDARALRLVAAGFISRTRHDLLHSPSSKVRSDR